MAFLENVVSDISVDGLSGKAAQDNGARPAISVVVPAYNMEQHLEECLESLRAQTFKDIEVIVVDDGSTDRTPDIIGRFAAADTRFVYVRQENGGVSKARNTGIERARGSYITFVDSDDYIMPDMLEKLYRRAVIDGSDCCMCDCAYVTETGKYPNTVLDQEKDSVLDEHGFWRLHYSGGQMICVVVWGKLFRRQLFDTVRFVVGHGNEDSEIEHRIAQQYRAVSVLAEPLYCYRQTRADSISRETSPHRVLGTIDALAKRRDYLCDRFPELEHRVLLEQMSIEAYASQWLKTASDDDKRRFREYRAATKSNVLNLVLHGRMSARYFVRVIPFLMGDGVYRAASSLSKKLAR